MKNNTVLRILGNALVIYALILFVVTAFYDGRQFGEDVSVLNYLVRMLFGFLPAIIFAVPGVFVLQYLCDIKSENFLESTVLYIDLFNIRFYGNCICMSIGIHIAMIMLSVVWKIFSFVFSILEYFP